MLRANKSFSIQPSQTPWKSDDLLLCFQGEAVLLPQAIEAELFLPTVGEILPLLPPELAQRGTLLCQDQETRLYGLDVEEGWRAPEGGGFAFQPVGLFRRLPRRQDGFWLITAYHLVTWARRNRFCGACGQPLAPLVAERALGCGSCGQVVYPIISPAVSVAITQGDRLLMARNARGTFRHFSLIAGYTEAGESLEDTVHREVMEEVGLRVKNLRYVGSQPWGVSQSLMVGFHGELEGSDEITLQESELAEARWFHRSEIAPDPDPLSLSFAIIESFRAGTLP